MWKPLHTLGTFATTGLLTGALLVGQVGGVVTHVNGGSACPAEQCVTLPAKDFSHSDVGSRGQGFGFYSDGPLNVLRPEYLLRRNRLEADSVRGEQDRLPLARTPERLGHTVVVE